MSHTNSIPCFANSIIRDALAHEMPVITELSVAAFTTFKEFGPPWFDDAGVLPAMLASLPGSLSRVAVDPASQQMVGHAQWTIAPMRLAGKNIKAAYLAPLSVHPLSQGQGVGGALMRDGIALLRQQGVGLLIILGHTDYYPRFGLLTGCHGRRGLTIAMPPAIATDPEGFTLRPVAVGDESACHQLWLDLCSQVEGAMDPGPGLLPWFSKTRDIVACILEHRGVVVGYARCDLRPKTGPAHGILRFLAADTQAALILAGRLVAWAKWGAPRLGLPLPMDAPTVQALLAGQDIQAANEWWDAGMAMDLGDGLGAGKVAASTTVATSLETIRAKAAPPLFIEWPPLFDF